MRIDDPARVEHHHDLLDLEPATAADRDGGAGRRDGAVRLDGRHPHALALGQVGPETRFLFEGLEHELPVFHALRHLEAPFERIPSARDRHLVDKGLGHEAQLVGAGSAMGRARDVSLGVVPLMLTMRNLVGHVVDAVVRGGPADLIDPVDGEPGRAREQRGGQPVVADGGGELGHGERTLLVLRQVFLARPDHLHRPAELLRDFGRLTGHARTAAAIAAESAAEEHGVA